ncbi:interleukin-1 beta [Zootoca vivipara]|uniref:interleukin-1 beta n=1 Tax=Zootoca vivipara TaxID=8524 RepID=UPI0015927D68|nr:interleukin-1 beta [Zootoca vivipara]
MSRVPEYEEEVMDFCSVDEMQFYEADQPSLAKEAFPGLNHPACTVGIQVKIANRPSAMGFQKAVIIMVAIERMKKKKKKKSTKARALFTDDDLMDIINSVLEPVDFDIRQCTYATDPIYHLSRSISCNIRDVNQKSLVLNGTTQLVALELQQADISREARVKMYVYRPKIEEGVAKIPIALKIKGKELYLSCVQSGDQPALQLEEASIEGDLDKSDKGRFLFYRVAVGDYTRFESAAFPQWYICTSAQVNKAVGVTNRIGEVSIVDYIVT